MNESDTFCHPDESDCPYTGFKETCKAHRDRCGKWVKLMAGKNAQTGEPIYQWACEDSWRPILAIEQEAAVKALDKNVELLRQEQVQQSAQMVAIMEDQRTILNQMGLILQRLCGEVLRQGQAVNGSIANPERLPNG